MKVRLISILGNKSKEVRNTFDISSIEDVEALIKACIIDKRANITREDGAEVSIVENGCVHIEVFNQKQLLVDWCNQKTNEFPLGGIYVTSSI